MTQRIDALHQFLEEDPDDSFTRFALAQEYAKQGDEDRALAFFEELVARDPSYVGTYYHLGKLYEQMGRMDAAVSTYERGVEDAATQRDVHARAELQDALLQAQGVG